MWFVNDIVTAMNGGENILCDVFEFYPSYVAGILDSVKEINFYVFCDKKLNYTNYIKNVFQVKSALLSRLQKTIYT
jgi:hypothetical protein